METNIERPNIFRISTKELSQDAFIVWMMRWANPVCKELDPLLHKCGSDFLSLLLNNKYEEKQISKVDAGRQWNNIDVWAEIFFSDGTKTLLILEDKTFSGEHSDQLNRYKKQAQDYCDKEGFDLCCTYFKIGSEPLRALKAIKDKGFHVVGRNEIRACLASFVDTPHSILRDFIDYIDGIDAEHNVFETLALKSWQGNAWVGFYQFVESRLEVNMWHRVNNPSGGFWNLCLTWDYWNGVPIYMQIEEQKLCFKIAPGKVETGFDMSDQEMNRVQDLAYSHLMQYASGQGMEKVRRPYPFVHRGNYRTFAVIGFEDWCGPTTELLDKDAVLSNLANIISFYHRFMKHLRTLDFSPKPSQIVE